MTQQYTDGIYHDMPDEIYFKLPRISKHATDEFAKNPYAFMRRREARISIHDDPTPEMQFGSALHCALLEPWRYEKDYAHLNADDLALIEGIRDELSYCTAVQEIFAASPKRWRETALLYHEDDMPWKAKLDLIAPEAETVLDVKTAADATAEGFMRACDNYHYHVQGAAYFRACERCGIAVKNFVLLAIEKKYPFTTGLYFFTRTSEFIRAGEYELNRRMEHMRKWQSYRDTAYQATNLPLPAWSKHLKQYRNSLMDY